ncbi:MAG: YaiO family outer membrane beta-barrel protein [Robiginitalea sp.]
MKKSLVFLLGGLMHIGMAQTSVVDPDAAFQNARELAFQGDHHSARDTLQLILLQFPEYTEVHTFLANTYRWEGDHEEARKHFNRITSKERGYEDVWKAAIQNEIQAGNPSIALGLANKALHYLGGNSSIEQLRTALLSGYQGTSAGDKTAETREFRNSLSVANRLEAFDKYYDPMLYTSLEYQRDTELGKVVPRVRYSNRFNLQGLQYEIDLYPRISKAFYGFVNYGYSDSELFPGHKAAVELYANLPKALEASLGGRYLSFPESGATLLTGSFGLYRGNYYMSFRPYLVMLGNRKPGGSGIFQVRKYLSDASNYLGLYVSYGYSPELRQLQSGTVLVAETLLFLESQQARFEYQFSTGGGQHLYQASLGVSRQEYLLEPDSFFWMISGGLTYKIRL